jgi:hypothetical protein
MVVTAGGTASADPSSTIIAAAPKPAPAPQEPATPRLLPSGAPACGIVMFKSYAPRPRCLAFDRKHSEALRKLATKIAALVHPKDA